MSEEQKIKLRDAKLRNPVRYWLHKRRFCIAGDKHYNWKGGVSSVRRLIRHSYKYRQWISDVFTRDDYTCQICYVRGAKLEAHHIKTFADIIQEYKIKTLDDALLCEELWNINNGATLCERCHDRIK